MPTLSGTWLPRALALGLFAGSATFTLGSTAAMTPLAAKARPRLLAIENVNVVTLVPGEPERLRRQTVIVRNGRIETIARSTRANPVVIPARATVINGRGLFLLPGLADMHAHMSWLQSGLGADATDLYDLFMIHGVTTVYNMHGFTADGAGRPVLGPVELKQRLARGEDFGPRLYSSSPIMREPRVSSPDVAEALVRQYAADGYDAIKVYNPLTADKYERIRAVANELGITILGHSPRSGSRLDLMLNDGHDQISHIFELSETAFSRTGQASPGADTDFPAVARKLVEHDVWVTPTIALSKHTAERFDPAHLVALTNAPWMRFVPRIMRNVWIRDAPPQFGWQEWWVERFEFQYRLARALQDEGVRLLMGGDPELPYKLHGLSLHEEMQSFVEAGFSEHEILTIASRNAAEFLGTLAEQGTIEVGKSPDMILVRGNPLRRLSNARRLEGIMLRQQWLTKSDLEARSLRVEQKFNR